MGYRSYLRGEITFSPPLTWQELRIIELPERCLFEFSIDEETVDTPEGELTRKSSQRIVPRFEDEVKAYTVDDDIDGLVALLDGRTFSGEIRIEGEESGDIHRFRGVDCRIVHEYAKLAWPDGTLEDAR